MNSDITKKFSAAFVALFEVEEALGPCGPGNDLRRAAFALRVKLGSLEQRAKQRYDDPKEKT